MAHEKISDPFEPLIKASDGSLVRESELDAYEAEKNLDVEENAKSTHEYDDEPVNRSRRNFLIGAGSAIALGALGGRELLDKVDVGEFEESAKKFLDSVEDRIERKKLGLTPIEQFQEFGKIKSLQSGIEAIQEKHFLHLTESDKGRHDMRDTVQNFKGIDMRKMAIPFQEKGLPIQLCYMIAIQETRGRNLTSWSGAKGYMGIMPGTAVAHGYKPTDVENPYIASKVAAKYCAEERKRFGNNGDMILHAYNGGGGLFGFTAQTEKIKRTAENFYRYMEGYMNARFEKYERQGYFEVEVKKGDTLSELSRDWGISLHKVLSQNNLQEDSIIHIGDTIRLPFVRTKTALEGVFSKELEVLRYTPEVKAKYEVLDQQGLLAHLEKDFVEKNQEVS